MAEGGKGPSFCLRRSPKTGSGKEVENVGESATTGWSDPHEADKISVDGVMKFLDDLNLSPDSRLVLLTA
ncbi:hypothetical protein TNCV_4943911 [Trichonephila clavipes]|nr:hypothetical protein TNCV_4943911 [Trichonephila clavipes]